MIKLKAQLAKIEDTIKMFFIPKVFVKLDEYFIASLLLLCLVYQLYQTDQSKHHLTFIPGSRDFHHCDHHFDHIPLLHTQGTNV